MNNENCIGYFFGNMYLSSIQHGIQAAHVIQVMATKYNQVTSNVASKIFNRWMEEDKTMILLNGGPQKNLQDLINMLNINTNKGTDYPVAYFTEEKGALNGALTSVGIVLPESIYNNNMDLNMYTYPHLTEKDVELYNIIKPYKLAH